MYEILVCPLKQLYQILRDCDGEHTAVLAVSSGEISQEHLSGTAQKLLMGFADTDDENVAQAFTDRHAAQIRQFVNALDDEIDTLFVCCDSGESRSTAMAAAILRSQGRDEWTVWNDPHYHPNPLVYRRLCDALGDPVTQAEMRMRRERSENALKNAIQAARNRK